MRTARSIALAAVVATIPACGGTAPCVAEFGPWYAGMPDRMDGMPDLEMLVGDVVETPLADHFRPTECLEGLLEGYGDSLFEARSADPAAVVVSHSGGVLTTVAHEVADSVRVTVTVSKDAIGEVPSAFHDFYVSVTAPR